jgi:hypothetical protein
MQLHLNPTIETNGKGTALSLPRSPRQHDAGIQVKFDRRT